jgi:hypothetical protein
VVAIPLAFGSQISPNAAATLLTGADPNNPAKKRVMNIVSAFLATAVAIENSPKTNIAGNIDNLRPHISDIGAQHKGPNANPMLLKGMISSSFARICCGVTYMYSEIDRTVTSLLTPTY